MGYTNILRPVNCTITFIAVLVGAWIGRGFLFSPSLLLAAIVGFMVCGFGNIVNDLADIEIDKINNPRRPLPLGQVHKKNVKILAVLLFILAALFSLSLGFLKFVLVFGASVLLLGYARYFKKTIYRNFVVVLLTGLSFVLGGLVAKNVWCLFAFVFSFFIHLPREIIKDVIDMKGDRQMGVISLPIVFGVEKAYQISALSLGLLAIILPLPFIFGILNARYMLVVLIIALPIIVLIVLKMLINPKPEGLLSLSRLLKVVMVVGLGAMIL